MNVLVFGDGWSTEDGSVPITVYFIKSIRDQRSNFFHFHAVFGNFFLTMPVIFFAKSSDETLFGNGAPSPDWEILDPLLQFCYIRILDLFRMFNKCLRLL